MVNGGLTSMRGKRKKRRDYRRPQGLSATALAECRTKQGCHDRRSLAAEEQARD